MNVGKSLDESNFYRKVKNECKDCLSMNFKCQLWGKVSTKKLLSSHIEYHYQKESNFDVLEKLKFENVNNRTLLVGSSISGRTYLTLKILSRMPNRDIFIFTKTPPEQYSNYKIKIKKIGEESETFKRIRKRFLMIFYVRQISDI